MTTHIVNTSGGAGSWATGRRVTQRMVPGDHLVLIFADTRTEDDDLYRFLVEATGNVLDARPKGTTGEFVALADGRDIWQVFRDKRFLGNSIVDPCSRILKRELIRSYIEERYTPDDTVVYVGIDWTEEHRFAKAGRYWAPFAVAAPLCEPPFLDRDEVMQWLRDESIEPPRLYALGFAHNNCGGFCVKAGHAAFRTLLEQLPERYAYHEAKEQELRDYLGKDVAVISDRTRAGVMAHLGLTEDDVEDRLVDVVEGGVARRRTHTTIRATGERLPIKVPITLRAFRERVEADVIDVDPLDLGGCGCFTPDDYPTPSANQGEPS